jgi:predicted RNA methylase
VRIPDDVLNVLAQSVVRENVLSLPGTLDRALYVRVAKVIEAAGGKWNRKAAAHIFPESAEDLVADMLTTRTVLDAKRELGFFATPPAVVDRVMALALVSRNHECLEPSAGEGVLARSMLAWGGNVDCFEVDHGRCLKLWDTRPGFRSVIEADFLQVTPRPIYDRVVMNPPFMRGTDVRHVSHALRFLKPRGVLVSVMSAGFEYRQDRGTATLREFASYWENLPEDSFAEVGTSVRTVVVVFNGD